MLRKFRITLDATITMDSEKVEPTLKELGVKSISELPSLVMQFVAEEFAEVREKSDDYVPGEAIDINNIGISEE